ncbi:hypothetical protein [Nocardia sp. CY41]|uniref:hypothetical protein n=1 Tax=Nocardia sp. CY41 TaxID=2608686 RepID=UPI00135A426E|nr:hypothetical protein [Nocardia sp. CY41]
MSLNDTARIAELEHEVARLRAAGKDVGEYIKALNQTALDATGMHDVINEKGDGDWQAVWENVADLGERLRQAEKRIAFLRREYRDLHVRCEELVGERNELRARVAELEAQVQR